MKSIRSTARYPFLEWGQFLKHRSVRTFVNQRFQALSQFGRYGNAVYMAGMVSGLRQYFFIRAGLNLSVAVETGVAAVKGFHDYWVFRMKINT